MEVFKERCLLKWLEIFEKVFPKQITSNEIEKTNPDIFVFELFIKYCIESMTELETANNRVTESKNKHSITYESLQELATPSDYCLSFSYKPKKRLTQAGKEDTKGTQDGISSSSSGELGRASKRRKRNPQKEAKKIFVSKTSSSLPRSTINTTTNTATRTSFFGLLNIRTIQDIPDLTEENYFETITDRPEIRFFELKSVQTSYSESECEIYNKQLEKDGYYGNYDPETPGWLEEGVLNFFVDFVCDNDTDNNSVSLTATLSTYYFMVAEAQDLPSVTPGGREIDWTNIELALFPINVQNDHWILVAIWPKRRQYSVLDPSSDVTRNHSPFIFNGIWKLETRLNLKLKEVVQQFDKQTNCWDCGVYVCAYASLIAKKEDTNTPIDPNRFRNRILAAIIGTQVDEETKKKDDDFYDEETWWCNRTVYDSEDLDTTHDS